MLPQSYLIQPGTISNSSMCTATLQIDRGYFAIHGPFLMDSHVKKLMEGLQPSESTTNLTSDSPGSIKRPSIQRKRKRKHQLQPNTNTIHHEQIKDFMSTALQELVLLGYQRGTFYDLPMGVRLLNNKEARAAAIKVREQADSFAETLPFSAGKELQVTVIAEPQPINNLANTIVHYTGSKPGILPICGNCFVLPPNCRFYMSDVEQLPALAALGQQYDFIVLDCPWVNKSVKRTKGYHVLQEADILGIPIGSLSNDGCIIAVWVTNNQTLMQFIQDELFPTWNVKFCAIWHWLKVTVSGEVVCDLDSHHKKPYEHIIIGQKCEKAMPVKIENHKVICSVPSSIHSHKPPLEEIVRPYLKNNSNNLELFARYLLPGWTSWGNEVLLLQHLKHFECVAIM